jgi:uncharacterized protein (TIGR02599 family)
MRPHPPMPSRRSAFTLIELLAAMAVLIVLLGIIVGVTNSVSTTMQRATAGIDALAGARAGFDTLNRSLSQATLNTYWEYDNPLEPAVYLRQSDLQFLIRQNGNYGQEIFFTAPETYSQDAGLRSTRGLLNACSAFVTYGSSAQFQPTAVDSPKFRYRLMFGIQPTEQLAIFNKPVRTGGQGESAYRAAVQTYWNAAAWITPIDSASTTGFVSPLADNVIALIAWPRLPVAEDSSGEELTPSGNFLYNSQANALSVPQSLTANQLPPVIQVTMIAISEASAARLDTGSSTPPADIEAALAGKFTQVASYQSDLDEVAKALADKNIEFKIFTTSVPLRESKWSRAQ